MVWTDGVTITRNTFSAPSLLTAGDKPRAPISVHGSHDVSVSGDQVRTPDAYAHPFVSVGPNIA